MNIMDKSEVIIVSLQKNTDECYDYDYIKLEYAKCSTMDTSGMKTQLKNVNKFFSIHLGGGRCTQSSAYISPRPAAGSICTGLMLRGWHEIIIIIFNDRL